MDFTQLLHDKYNININDYQLELFEQYYQLLIEWNKKMNLTGITDRDEVYIKHFCDSLSLTKTCKLTNQSLLDVGSGAGFPSIPLKIIFPDLEVTIIDSLGKRIKFLDTLTSKLGLKDITLIHGRIEEHKKRNYYDIVTARAVAKLNILTELCAPFVKNKGVYIAMKGARYEEELLANMTASKLLNVNLEDTVLYDLNNEKRALLIYKKNKNSPEKYPRVFSKIKSKPL